MHTCLMTWWNWNLNESEKKKERETNAVATKVANIALMFSRLQQCKQS